MRFFQNGDFTTRSNGVETAYRRVNPDDWDDDGIANERDLNPFLCDGNFYGVANALPSNANLNAYYWLDLSVTGLLDCATIPVTSLWADEFLLSLDPSYETSEDRKALLREVAARRVNDYQVDYATNALKRIDAKIRAEKTGD